MAKDIIIAIVLTACGIETRAFFTSSLRLFVIAIVLTACGIETRLLLVITFLLSS